MNPAEAEKIIKMAGDTAREVSRTLVYVTAAGMILSMFAAAAYGWTMSGHDPVAAGKAIGNALLIDLLLFRWLRVAGRLRWIGAATRSGKVLDAVALLMTYYLSALGGLAMIVEPRSAVTYALVWPTYLFAPTVMALSYVAMPKAQQTLRDAAEAARAAIERAGRAAAQERAEEDRRARAARDAVTIAADNKAAEEAIARTREADAQIAANNKAAEEAIARTREADAQIAVAKAVSRQRRQLSTAAVDRSRRQLSTGRVDSSSTARQQLSTAAVDSSSTAAVDSSSTARQQLSTAAVDSPGPASTPTLEELLTYARADLSTCRKMGRPTLARWLSTAAGGRPVSSHRAGQVQAAIKIRSVTDMPAQAAGG